MSVVVLDPVGNSILRRESQSGTIHIESTEFGSAATGTYLVLIRSKGFDGTVSMKKVMIGLKR